MDEPKLLARYNLLSRYRGVDWTKRDTEIARELHVRPESVRQARGRLGVPKIPNKGTCRLPRPLQEQIVERALKGETLLSIANTLNVARSTVWRLCHTCGVPPQSRGRRRRKDCVLPDWTRLVDWDQQNTQIAYQLGKSKSLVSRYRRVLGKQRYEGSVARVEVDWGKVDWDKGFKKLSEELGVSYGTVANYWNEIKFGGYPVTHSKGQKPATPS